MRKFETKKELVEWVETMHLQNTNGRETEKEMFRLGIEAAIEELIEQWMEVRDELPPNKNKKYLVIRDGKIEICKWMYRPNGKGYWWNYLGITHWMQLPESPCC